ncbi:hypothetical protein EIM50_13610 [Pseudoxanthomonas sp. SGD-10]|nr:hypothetical protein EIM50_13610 [Pseudoxanthomonas sp. SGD-10]
MNQWLLWFPAAAEGSRWRLIRFKEVDADGKPVGKAEEALSAAGHGLRFPTEERAAMVAKYLNEQEAADA